MIKTFKMLAKRWLGEKDGIASVEAALIFPIMMVLLLGTFDTGNAILANQKTIRASQVAGDLITRERTVSTADINEAVQAAMLALVPEDTTSFGIDIASIGFDDNSVAHIVWRETRNMAPNAEVLDKVTNLAEANGGVVVVTIHYTYNPVFSNFIIGNIPMEEIAFTRGRKSAVVNKV